MPDRISCVVCKTPFTFTWCDTHGVGACVTCGMPYTIYHYEKQAGKEVRVDKPPSPAIVEWAIPGAIDFWGKKKSRVFPGQFDMGFLHGRSSTFSGATEEDMAKFNPWFNEWATKHAPKAAEGATP